MCPLPASRGHRRTDGRWAGSWLGNQSSACPGACWSHRLRAWSPQGALAGAAAERLARDSGQQRGRGGPGPPRAHPACVFVWGHWGWGLWRGSSLPSSPTGSGGTGLQSAPHTAPQQDGRESHGQAVGDLTSFQPGAAVNRGRPSRLRGHSQAGRRETGQAGPGTHR